MPSICSAQKLQSVWTMWQKGFHRFQIAIELSISIDNIDGYMLAAAKKFTTPKLKYKTDNESSLFPLFPAAAPTQLSVQDPQPKKFQRPPAVYSNKQYNV